MARIRTIKPQFFLNEDVSLLPFEWRLLFIGLWTQADREGRLEDRSMRLKAALFPYDDIDIEDGLAELARHRFIERYQSNNQRLIFIPTFLKHQQPNVKEQPSELPAFTGSTVQARCNNGVSTTGKERKGKEQEGNGMEGSAVTLRDTTPSPGVLVFPTVGRGEKSWALTAAQIAEWQTCYPGIGVEAECRKALAWVLAKSERRKTARGMPAFLVGWLNRSTDRGNGHAPTTTAASPEPSYEPWSCPHVDECAHKAMCRHKVAMGERKYPLKGKAS